MAASEVFDWVADQLVERTMLTRLEARGTVRLVVRDAGLNPETVAAFQMRIVLTRLMPSALEKRRIEGAKELCATIADTLDSFEGSTPREDAYDVFERLEGRGSGGTGGDE